ncbi:MAG: tetratricopeptide repeat protein [Candidatus Omnitrophica bacterium]|nr:tetratricopeptide repeat protein [Candidatus Omnitrophota bacterium]
MKKTILILSCFLFLLATYIFAADDLGDKRNKALTDLQLQARDYREQGLKMQEVGDLDAATKLYQKSEQLDPSYAVVCNDLGIIYEAKGEIDRAEESYLKSINIDPHYLSAYSNLAILYEGERKLGKAAFCWKRRVDLGDPKDPWTLKARQRLEDIRLALSPRPSSETQEREVVGLMKDVTNEKYVVRHDDKAFARKKFQEAKFSYGKEDYATALQDASDAQFLDPDNKEIDAFIVKTQNRALTQ